MSALVRVAVVGSGSAGFYAAGQLLAHADAPIAVDVYDRLATPWGLVRAGVAPDHPKIKLVTRVFERTARRAGFRFLGNVEVGRDVTHEELASVYHAVLYAVGAASDRRLGIPGEQLPGSHAATEFVGWYNGHPDHADHDFALDCERAVVIGNGNVALDVARMLALDPRELEGTDIADHALERLRASAIREVVVLGRRGPAQAAYTEPELSELAALADADLVVDPAEARLDPISLAALARDGAEEARELAELVARLARRPPAGKRRRILLRFLASPVELLGAERVEGLRIVRNRLVDDGPGRVTVRATGLTETIEAGLVLRSIGYRGLPLPGLPYDEQRGTIVNDCGRVTEPGARPLPGVYTAGWAKRGPSGIVGTNKQCASETVELLLADLAAGRLRTPVEPEALLTRLAERGVEVVDLAGWEAIDAHERGLGEPHRRPRVKLVRRDELLARARRSL